jgi:hypothetical protein
MKEKLLMVKWKDMNPITERNGIVRVNIGNREIDLWQKV